MKGVIINKMQVTKCIDRVYDKVFDRMEVCWIVCLYSRVVMEFLRQKMLRKFRNRSSWQKIVLVLDKKFMQFMK